MATSWSQFGSKLTQKSGILALMDDLGHAMSRGNVCMMGGGNPARIPAVEKRWRKRMTEIMADGDLFERMLANYDRPQGQFKFIDSLVGFLNQRFGWNLSEKNIAVTNGSQNAFFYLFNLLAGDQTSGKRKKILLPMSPEYIGYADQGVAEDIFVSYRPNVEHLPDRTFKYHVNFDPLVVDDHIAAICASRPTNPTGNVLTDQEVQQLLGLAETHDVPLILDNAYGAPFPGIIFSDIQPTWSSRMILAFSLSKLGLPGTRTGIVVADEPIVSALSAVNSIVSLANGNIGQTIVEPMIQTGEIETISREVIRPFYEEKSLLAQAMIREMFDDDLPYHVHKSEGALFHWLWFEDLPITTTKLYERLKDRGVIVVPGHYFFHGLEEPWRHTQECIRVNYSQPEEQVRKGLQILAEELARAYVERP